MRTTSRLGALLAALLVTSAAHAEIKIGVSIGLTGPGASVGIPLKNALALWPDAIGGEKLNVIILDDAGDPATATKNARRLIDEDKVDVILGSANTPSTIAIASVSNERKTVQLSPAPAELPPGADPYVFRAVMHGAYWSEGLVQAMKKAGVKSVGFLGVADAYGEAFLQGVSKQADGAGLKMVAVERFNRSDATVTAQALKLVSANPDAILVVAIGGGAAMPQKALMERGYKGKIYHTSASVSPDFLRLAGKDAEGALVISGPEQVPEQLPDAHPGKKVALQFVQAYEAKYGLGSRTQFAAHVYDFGLVLEQIVPVALMKAKPGTPEFREALKTAIEATRTTVTKGVLAYTPTDHWGHDSSARVMLTVADGKWKLVP